MLLSGVDILRLHHCLRWTDDHHDRLLIRLIHLVLLMLVHLLWLLLVDQIMHRHYRLLSCHSTWVILSSCRLALILIALVGLILMLVISHNFLLSNRLLLFLIMSNRLLRFVHNLGMIWDGEAWLDHHWWVILIITIIIDELILMLIIVMVCCRRCVWLLCCCAMVTDGSLRCRICCLGLFLSYNKINKAYIRKLNMIINKRENGSKNCSEVIVFELLCNIYLFAFLIWESVNYHQNDLND